MSASLLTELKTTFTEETHGPVLNELLLVLHFMGTDEATKAAFCRQVVVPGGWAFLTRFQNLSKERLSRPRGEVYRFSAVS